MLDIGDSLMLFTKSEIKQIYFFPNYKKHDF